MSRTIHLKSDPERPFWIFHLVDHGSPEVNERTANRATKGDHPMKKSIINYSQFIQGSRYINKLILSRLMMNE